MTRYKVTAWSDLYLPAYGRLRQGDEVDIPDADGKTAEELVERGLLSPADPAPEPKDEPTDSSVDEKMGSSKPEPRKRSR